MKIIILTTEEEIIIKDVNKTSLLNEGYCIGIKQNNEDFNIIALKLNTLFDKEYMIRNKLAEYVLSQLNFNQNGPVFGHIVILNKYDNKDLTNGAIFNIKKLVDNYLHM